MNCNEAIPTAHAEPAQPSSPLSRPFWNIPEESWVRISGEIEFKGGQRIVICEYVWHWWFCEKRDHYSA